MTHTRSLRSLPGALIIVVVALAVALAIRAEEVSPSPGTGTEPAAEKPPTNGGEKEEQNDQPARITEAADWVARVEHHKDGWTETITRRDFHKRLLERHGATYRAHVTDPRMLLPKIVEMLPLNFLDAELEAVIDGRLLRRAHERDPDKVPRKEIDEKIKEERKKTREGYKGQFTLEDILARQGVTFDEYKRQVEMNLWLTKKLEKKATPKALTDYSLKNRAYFAGVRRYISQIYIEAVPERQKPIEKSDANGRPLAAKEIEKRKKARLDEQWKKATERLNAAVAHVRKEGMNGWANAVATYSDDAATKESQGVLGYVAPRYDRFHQAILDAAFRPKSPLPNGGALSEPAAKTERGYHLIWVWLESDPGNAKIDDPQLKKAITDAFLLEERGELLKRLRDECAITKNLWEGDE
ncbi:MAG: peptidylprolyl isomerase [Planctomycetes bacterium]|nr:peptidylprolyl isomerase [Planctomycetota bacterium]